MGQVTGSILVGVVAARDGIIGGSLRSLVMGTTNKVVASNFNVRAADGSSIYSVEETSASETKKERGGNLRSMRSSSEKALAHRRSWAVDGKSRRRCTCRRAWWHCCPPEAVALFVLLN